MEPDIPSYIINISGTLSNIKMSNSTAFNNSNFREVRSIIDPKTNLELDNWAKYPTIDVMLTLAQFVGLF